MPNIACLSPTFRKEFLALAKAAGVEADDLKKIRGIPECEGSSDIGFVRGKRAGGGSSRKPTERNVFMGNCMRGPNGRSMQECSTAFKSQKK